MKSPVLYDPIRVPRYPIVLSHGTFLSFEHTMSLVVFSSDSLAILFETGLYGFDVRGIASLGPRWQIHYWGAVLEILRGKVGAEVVVTGVPA